MEGRPLATQYRDAHGHITYGLGPYARPTVLEIIERLRREHGGKPHPSTLVTIELLEYLVQHQSLTPIDWYAEVNPQPQSDAYVAGATYLVTLLRVHNVEV